MYEQITGWTSTIVHYGNDCLNKQCIFNKVHAKQSKIQCYTDAQIILYLWKQFSNSILIDVYGYKNENENKSPLSHVQVLASWVVISHFCYWVSTLHIQTPPCDYYMYIEMLTLQISTNLYILSTEVFRKFIIFLSSSTWSPFLLKMKHYSPL